MAAEMAMAPLSSQLPQYPSCALDLEDKSHHKETFYKEFENFIRNTDVKRQAKCVIRQELYDKSLACLKSPRGEKFEDCRLKSWAKSKFVLMNVDGKESVYCAKTRLPVVTFENMFDTIDEAHNRIGHHGRDKTRDEILQSYAFVPYKAVEIYVKSCQHCSTKGPTRRAPPEKPLMVMSFMTRVQAELIDLCSRSDGKYTFVLHLRDHFSKYCWLFPLRHKETRCVAKKIFLIFSMFGSPRILYCDNGNKDFFSEIVKSFKATFPGLVLRSGRLRYPQLQGLAGRTSNDDVLKILYKMMEERNTEQWSKLLPDVTASINNYTSSVRKKTPYEIVFGQKPQRYARFYDTLAALDVMDSVSVEALMAPTAPANQHVAMPTSHIPASQPQTPHVPSSIVQAPHVPTFHQLHYGVPCYNH